MSLEKESRKRTRKVNLQKIILSTVEIGGMLALATLAPNVLGAMGKLGLMPHQRQTESIMSARTRLIQKGFLKYKNGFLEITPLGRRFLQKKTLIDNYKNQKKKWDGRWRVLIFDIPENRRRDRDHIRQTLIDIGFVRLQKSVWVFPYDCEEFVTLLKADMKIGKNVLYMIVDAIEYDKPLKSCFNLQ